MLQKKWSSKHFCMMILMDVHFIDGLNYACTLLPVHNSNKCINSISKMYPISIDLNRNLFDSIKFQDSFFFLVIAVCWICTEIIDRKLNINHFKCIATVNIVSLWWYHFYFLIFQHSEIAIKRIQNSNTSSPTIRLERNIFIHIWLTIAIWHGSFGIVTLSGHVRWAFFPSRHTLLMCALEDLNRVYCLTNEKETTTFKHAY